MMRSWTPLLLLCFFTFQNCGSFDSPDSFEYYSYGPNTPFFYDVKLIERSLDAANRTEYTFDVAISFATDVAQAVGYRIDFFTPAVPVACLPVEGAAVGNNKHFRVSCLTPSPETLFIRLIMAGPNNIEEAHQFRF